MTAHSPTIGCCGLLLLGVLKALLYSSKCCLLSLDIKVQRCCTAARDYTAGSWPDPGATNVVHRARHKHKTLSARANHPVGHAGPAVSMWRHCLSLDSRPKIPMQPLKELLQNTLHCWCWGKALPKNSRSSAPARTCRGRSTMPCPAQGLS